MSLTRGKVALRLEESPYRIKVNYTEGSLVYVFSSNLYKQKFCERIAGNRDEITRSLSNRFGFVVNNDRLSDLRLYTSIEKRGFLVIKDNGEEIVCQNNLILDGEKLIRRNSSEQ